MRFLIQLVKKLKTNMVILRNIALLVIAQIVLSANAGKPPHCINSDKLILQNVLPCNTRSKWMTVLVLYRNLMPAGYCHSLRPMETPIGTSHIDCVPRDYCILRGLGYGNGLLRERSV